MKFWEAMKALESGKKVRDTQWVENAYIYGDDNGFILDENNETVSSDDFNVTHEWEEVTNGFRIMSKTGRGLLLEDCPYCHFLHCRDDGENEYKYCPYCGKKVN